MTGGGIAQLARVLGSYPIGRWFESCCRYHSWPVGQEVKTPPFHGGIMGSIPVRVTNNTSCLHVFFYHSWPVGQEVKTPPFHGGIMGSIPVRVTNQKPWNENFQGFLYFMGNLEKEEF